MPLINTNAAYLCILIFLDETLHVNILRLPLLVLTAVTTLPTEGLDDVGCFALTELGYV